MWQRNITLCIQDKVMFGANPSSLHIFKHGGDCIVSWVCLSLYHKKLFSLCQRNRIELSTGIILEECLVQSVFQQTLGDKLTFQQDNNLKHNTKYTMDLLAKMTLNVPE